MLSWGSLLASFVALCRRSASVVFHRKLPFMAVGIGLYYGALYALAVLRPGEGLGVGQAAFVLVEIPGAVLAIYLTMDQIAAERDGRTLETLFSTATSHYGLWTVRLTAVFAVLAAVLVGMSAAAYVLFAEFPFVWAGFNAFVPAFLFGNLTFCLSVYCRSGNTAGMLALAVMIVVLLSAQGLQGSVYYLFLNPFVPPLGLDLAAWEQTVWINRGWIAAAGCVLGFLGLRRMEDRERLLG